MERTYKLAVVVYRNVMAYVCIKYTHTYIHTYTYYTGTYIDTYLHTYTHTYMHTDTQTYSDASSKGIYTAPITCSLDN